MGPRESSPVWTWPLIGRDRELERLAAARADSACRGVVLVGDAGVGKSRLAREVQAAAQQEGAFAPWIQATRSAAAVPLGALGDLVPHDVRSDDTAALMRGCARAVRAQAADGPVVVCVDDAHLLDPASSAVVLHLAQSQAGFIVTTVRAGVACPDAIVALWKDGLADRIELSELADDRVQELLEVALGDAVEAAVVRWVITIGVGNPLYIRELVRAALEDGSLVHIGGLWRLRGRPQTSSSLVELVAQRTRDLTPAERDAVELLALGEPLGLAEITRVCPSDALVSTEARGLVAADGADIRLAHPLYGEAVRAGLPPLRGRELRLRLVEILEARRPFGPDEALRVARLRLDAGAALPNELTLEAARAANRAGDPELGEQLAELAALDGGGVAAALLLAQARTMRNRFAEAEDALAAVEGLAPGDALDSEYVKQRVWVLHFGLRDPAAAQALLDRAAGWSDEPRWAPFLERMRRLWGAAARGGGDPAEVAAAVAVNDSIPDEMRRLAGVLHRLSLLISGDGDRAAQLAFATPPPVPLRDLSDAAALAALTVVALDSGQRWNELRAYLEKKARDAIRLGDELAAGLTAFGFARLHLLEGRYHDAGRWAAEAEAQLERQDPYSVMIHVRVVQVGTAAFTGDFAATASAVSRLRASIAEREPNPAQQVAVCRAEGWATWQRSPAPAARQMLDDAERLASTLPGLAPQLAYDALRAGGPAAPLLTAMAESCHSRLVAAFARHGAARASRSAPELLAVCEEMADIGARRYAVEAATEAAATFVSEGRADSARRAAARARELHVDGQGAVLPAVDGLDTTAVELTPREAQLLDLASQGLSNAEIADRLVISVRTVETHIYRGMQKLGVSDRRELASRRPSADPHRQHAGHRHG